MIRVTEVCRKPAELSASQKVSKKYKRAQLRKLKRKEYKKLRKVVPSVAHKTKVSKVTIIEEAIRYIDELHEALAMRLHSQGVTSTEETQSAIRQMVLPFLMSVPGQQLPAKSTAICEKQLKVPTFLQVPGKLYRKQ